MLQRHIIQNKFRFLGLMLGLCTATSLEVRADEINPMGTLRKQADKISELTEDRLNLSGYINGHYMNHNGVAKLTNKNINKPLFQIREASVFADLTLTDNLLFSTELETSYDFSSKDASGRDDRFEALFNYYYFDYDIASSFDWDTDKYGGLSLRAGRILVPFLSYNENKPNFKQYLMSQPFTAQQLSPVNNAAIGFQQFGWTDTGASLNWNYVIEDNGLVDIKLSIINGLGSDVDALDANEVQLSASPTVRPRDGLFANKSDWNDFDDNNSDKAVVLKASYAPFSMPLDLGVSYYHGAWDKSENNDISMLGFHLNYIEKDWSLRGEYVRADVEQTAGINTVIAAGPAAINTTTGDYNMSAWYVEGSYIPIRYGTGDNRYVRVIARYDDVDTNDKAAFTPFDRSRVTLGTEWGFIDNMRLRYEWQRQGIDSFENAPAAYVASGGKEHINMQMISLIAHF